MVHGFNDVNKEKVDLLNFFYPVGTIYETTDADFNPGTTWGGTWVKIEGRMLIGAGSGYNSGATGGAASVSYKPTGSVQPHVLTVSEMPSHSHNYTKATGVGNHTLTINEIPSHKHDVSASESPAINQSASSGVTAANSLGSGFAGAGVTIGVTENSKGGGQAHNHPLTTTTDGVVSAGGNAGHNHSFSGTQATIQTMPPFVAVNIWKRTA